MLLQLDANAASRVTRFTEYGEVYNHFHPPRDRIMPTMLGLQNYLPTPFQPRGFRAYNTPPTLALETQEFSRMAYDDIPSVNKGLPWERVRKSAMIG